MLQSVGKWRLCSAICRAMTLRLCDLECHQIETRRHTHMSARSLRSLVFAPEHFTFHLVRIRVARLFQKKYQFPDLLLGFVLVVAATIGPGEMFVVSKGVEHKPFADKEVKLMLIEPRGVLNTGHEGGERTATNDVWI